LESRSAPDRNHTSHFSVGEYRQVRTGRTSPQTQSRLVARGFQQEEGINYDETFASDILGYVSTLARDNPYFDKHVPSHLDGLQAARALRDVRVTIGDVHKKQDVGHVAFASVDVGPERVNIKRMYD
jgi:hypothetical protein